MSELEKKMTAGQEKQPSTGFMHLTPTGVGFLSTSLPGQKVSVDLSVEQEMSKYQSILLRECGYTSLDHNEMERAFGMKAAFILRNRRYLKQEGLAILLLVADQQTLFKDGDQEYRSRKVNLKFEKQQRQRKRHSSDDDAMIEAALDKTVGTNDSYRAAARQLLKRMLREKRYQGLEKWVFSEKHMVGQTAAARSRQSGKSTYDRKPDPNGSDVFVLDIPAFRESCFALCSKEEQQQFKDFFQTDFQYFTENTLREFLLERKLIALSYRPSASFQMVYSPAFQRGLRMLKKRYDRLSSLKKAYVQADSNRCLSQQLSQCRIWETKRAAEHYAVTYGKKRIEVLRFADAIDSFFQRLGIPLAPDKESLLARICWVIEDAGFQEEMIPMALVLMVLSCGKQIAYNQDMAFKPHQFPRFFKNPGRALQRFETLRLLRCFFDLLDLGQEERISNWEEYIRWQGRSILSRDEYIFWCKELKGLYENLPDIGFQLDYLNNCTQALPPHSETLCYTSCSRLHLGGYHQFFKQNKHKLRHMALNLDHSNQRDIRTYKHICNDYKLTNPERQKRLYELDSIKVDLSAFVGSEQYCSQESQYELTCLIRETVLRIYLNREARKLLLRNFQSIGDDSLERALYDRLDLSSSRGTSL